MTKQQPHCNGQLHLHPTTLSATWKGCLIKLSPVQHKVLQRLAGPDRPLITYRDMYDTIKWPGCFGGSGEDGYKHNVRAFVLQLRKRFRKVDPTAADFIENVPRVGYRLCEDVTDHSPSGEISEDWTRAQT